MPRQSRLPEFTDTERMEYLASHVVAVSTGPGKRKFGFDFDSGRKSDPKYYNAIREMVDERLREGGS